MFKAAISGSAVLLATLSGNAGPKFTYNEGKSNLELIQTDQVWGAYTRPFDNIPATDSRADLFLKQGRIGFKGQILPGLSYSTIFACDNLGKDQFTGALGSAQTTRVEL
jgi:hypothetical protein